MNMVRPFNLNHLSDVHVGDFTMSLINPTRTATVTHFSMWSILKSPLILGNDVTDMVRSTPITPNLPLDQD